MKGSAMLGSLLIMLIITVASLSADTPPAAPQAISIPPGIALDKTLAEEIRKERWPTIMRFYWKTREAYLTEVVNKGITDNQAFEWRWAEFQAFQETHRFIASIAGPDYLEMVHRQALRYVDTNGLWIKGSELDKMLNLQAKIEYSFIFGLSASDEETKERFVFIKSHAFFSFYDMVFAG
jgi:hypothetical protein